MKILTALIFTLCSIPQASGLNEGDALLNEMNNFVNSFDSQSVEDIINFFSTHASGASLIIKGSLESAFARSCMCEATVLSTMRVKRMILNVINHHDPLELKEVLDLIKLLDKKGENTRMGAYIHEELGYLIGRAFESSDSSDAPVYQELARFMSTPLSDYMIFKIRLVDASSSENHSEVSERLAEILEEFKLLNNAHKKMIALCAFESFLNGKEKYSEPQFAPLVEEFDKTKAGFYPMTLQLSRGIGALESDFSELFSLSKQLESHIGKVFHVFAQVISQNVNKFPLKLLPKTAKIFSTFHQRSKEMPNRVDMVKYLDIIKKEHLMADDVNQLGPEERQFLFKDIYPCKKIHSSQLSLFSQLNDISPECLALMPGINGSDATDLQEIVSKLPDNAFSIVYQNLNPGTISGLTTPQLKSFADSSPDCSSGVHFSLFTDEQLLSLNPVCLGQALNANLNLLNKFGGGPIWTRLESEGRQSVCSQINIMNALSLQEISYSVASRIPETCWIYMKGLYERPDAKALDLSQQIHNLEPFVFRKLLGKLHSETVKAITPEVAQFIGIDDPTGCRFLDYRELASKEVFLAMSNSCLARSFNRFLDKIESGLITTIWSILENYGSYVFPNSIDSKTLLSLVGGRMLNQRHYPQAISILNKDAIFHSTLVKHFEPGFKIANRGSFCSMFKFDHFNSKNPVNKNKLIMQDLTSECILQTVGFKDKLNNLSTLYPVLPETLFSHFRDDISDISMESMPINFVQHFGEANPNDCHKYNITLFGHNMEHTNVNCLSNWLSMNEKYSIDHFSFDSFRKFAKNPLFFHHVSTEYILSNIDENDEELLNDYIIITKKIQPIELLNWSERYKKMVRPKSFGIFDFQGVDKINLNEFRTDILADIRTPLNVKVSMQLPIEYITEKVCSLHFPTELPSHASQVENCMRLSKSLAKLFKNGNFWRIAFWSVMEPFFKISSVSDINHPSLKKAFNKLRSLEDFLLQSLFSMTDDEKVESLKFLHGVIHDNILLNKEGKNMLGLELLRNNRHFFASLTIDEVDDIEPTFGIYDRKKLNITIKENEHHLGMMFPMHLYNDIVKNGFKYAGHSTKIINGLGTDASGLSNNYTDQLISMVLEGPKEEMVKKEQEMFPEMNIPSRCIDRPILVSELPSGRSFGTPFFPYRADPALGTFVAYTIVKALQSGVASSIILPHKFYCILATIDPEGKSIQSDIQMVSAFHDEIYRKSLSQFLWTLRDEFTGASKEEFAEMSFPKLGRFSGPFGGEAKVSYNLKGADNEEFMPIEDEKELLEYLEKYKKETIDTFYDLLVNFRRVFRAAYDLKAISYLYEPKMFTKLMEATSYQLNELLNALYIPEGDNKIDSLVRLKSSRKIIPISLKEAIEVFLRTIDAKKHRLFVAMFTGSTNYRLSPGILKLFFKFLNNNSVRLEEIKSFWTEIDLEEAARLVRSCYEAEIKRLGVNPEEVEMVEHDTFVSATALTCFKHATLSNQSDNFQIIYALIEQLNIPVSAIID